MIKRFTLFIALMITIGSIAFADEVTKTYTFNNTEISKSGEYDILYFENTRLAGKIGEPALPYRAAKIMLPPGQVAVDVEFIGKNMQTISTNFNAYPMQPSRPISAEKTDEFYKNNSTYNSNEKFPATPTGNWSTEYMNGYSFLIATFTPTEYFAKEKTLKYYQNVTIKVTTKASAKAANSTSNISTSKQIAKRVKQYADNPEMLYSYPDKAKGDGDYQLLVVTGTDYTEDFEQLTNFYLQQGLKSKIKSVEEINAEMSGQDSQEKIRNYIIQEYQTNGVEIVILGGDVEIVPYRGFYCTVESSSTYEDDNIPTDLYYSALDGTWDDDNDGLWGEPDEDDLIPEVAVARMPFSNENELSSMLNKTMNFQANPVVGELRDPLLAGEHLYDGPETNGSDYLDLLIGHHEDNGYTTDGIPEDFDIHKLYYIEVGNWSGSDIMDEVNQGRSLLFHVGHANSNTVMNLYTSDITNENFSGANGVDHNFTIVYTHGCICGSFDNSDCIAEHMVKIDNFAAAFIGNSRYGWFNEGQTEGPSQHIHREFTDAIFTSANQRIGAAHMESKAETAPWVEAPGQWEEGAIRWCFYDCNVLGDAAMRVWTDEPIDITVNYPNAIQIDESSIEVTVQTGVDMLENYSCTLMQNNEFIGTGITNASGEATVSIQGVLEIGDAQLIVSGNNITPQTYNVTIIPSEGAYLILENYSLNDGNNNIPENGDEIQLTLDMHNAGIEDASDVNVTIACADSYIEITDNQENYGTIAGESTVSMEDGFSFNIIDGIPDQHQIEFVVTATSGDSWVSNFTITVNAPELLISNISIDDSETGNNNHQLDPGETAIISIDNTNTGHNNITNLVGTLSVSDLNITINNTTANIIGLPVGETSTTQYEVTISSSAQIGDMAEFSYNLATEYYSADKDFTLAIGEISETFETGNFDTYNWNFSSTPWQITSEEVYEGTYSSVSGIIGDGQKTEMLIEMDVQTSGTLSFYRKVSSENNYDYLYFYIDDVEINKWSGEMDWELIEVPVSQGIHTFKWSYKKDGSSLNGSDCAWVDNIKFPTGNFTTDINDIVVNTELNIYPTPAKDIVNIAFNTNNKSKLSIQIVDTYGHVVKHYNNIITSEKGIMKARINVQDLSAGAYFVLIRTKNTVSSKQLIITK